MTFHLSRMGREWVDNGSRHPPRPLGKGERGRGGHKNRNREPGSDKKMPKSGGKNEKIGEK